MNIAVLLDTRVTRKSNLYPLVVRLTHKNKQRYFSTGYRFEKGGWPCASKHPQRRFIESKIDDIKKAISKYFAECELTGAKIHLDRIGEKKNSYSFIEYLKHRAKQYGANDQPEMQAKINRHVLELTESSGDIHFDDITQDRLRDHEAYLKNIPNGDNTRNKKFQTLREMYNAAINEGKAPAPNPFNLYKIKAKPVKKEKLSTGDIAEIEKLDLAGAVDLARDIFLFSYYTKGSRFQTCITLKRSDIKDGRVYIKMNKGQKFISVKIHPRLQAIIDKYKKGKFLFNLIEELPETRKEVIKVIGPKNTIINRNLKTVAALAGIDKPLTMHIARHSFAYHLKHTASSMLVLQDALGHSDSRITERYLKSLGDETLDKEMEKVYGG